MLIWIPGFLNWRYFWLSEIISSCGQERLFTRRELMDWMLAELHDSGRFDVGRSLGSLGRLCHYGDSFTSVDSGLPMFDPPVLKHGNRKGTTSKSVIFLELKPPFIGDFHGFSIAMFDCRRVHIPVFGVYKHQTSRTGIESCHAACHCELKAPQRNGNSSPCPLKI